MKNFILFTLSLFFISGNMLYAAQNTDRQEILEDQAAKMILFIEEQKSKCSENKPDRSKVIDESEILFREYSRYMDEDDDAELNFRTEFFYESTGNICNANVDELKQLQKKNNK